MAEHANREQNYFIKENLQGLDEQIAKLKGDVKEFDFDNKFYKFNAYYYDNGRNGTETIATVTVTTPHDLINQGYYLTRQGVPLEEIPEKMGYKKLSDSDTEKYLYYLERTKADFEKRLQVYLKKYGTSKLRCWSYLVD